MALFDTSFLSNPFTTASQATTTDAMGNIFNANGVHIGAVPGSQADIGTAGFPVVPTSTGGTPAAAAPTDPNSAWSIVTNAVKSGQDTANLYKPSAIWSTVASWLSTALVEDTVFIIIGLLLIFAALFSFALKGTEVVVGGASKTAGRVSGVARNAAKVAEVAAV